MRLMEAFLNITFVLGEERAVISRARLPIKEQQPVGVIINREARKRGLTKNY
jgi:hypothetical protein